MSFIQKTQDPKPYILKRMALAYAKKSQDQPIILDNLDEYFKNIYGTNFGCVTDVFFMKNKFLPITTDTAPLYAGAYDTPQPYCLLKNKRDVTTVIDLNQYNEWSAGVNYSRGSLVKRDGMVFWNNIQNDFADPLDDIAEIDENFSADPNAYWWRRVNNKVLHYNIDYSNSSKVQIITPYSPLSIGPMLSSVQIPDDLFCESGEYSFLSNMNHDSQYYSKVPSLYFYYLELNNIH